MKKKNTSVKTNTDGTKTVWSSEGYNGKIPAPITPKAPLSKHLRANLKLKKENPSKDRSLGVAYTKIVEEGKRKYNVEVEQILTPEDLLVYLKNTKRAQANKTQVVLKILLNHSGGLPRCCLRDALREKGVDVVDILPAVNGGDS